MVKYLVRSYIFENKKGMKRPDGIYKRIINGNICCRCSCAYNINTYSN